MKIKYKSKYHKKAFTDFIRQNVRNPYLSRYEYISAVFLLSADKFLWEKIQGSLTSYSVDLRRLNLNGISTNGYALYKAAKSLYTGDPEISVSELCDIELISHSTMLTIINGILLCRYGIGMLNWEV